MKGLVFNHMLDEKPATESRASELLRDLETHLRRTDGNKANEIFGAPGPTVKGSLFNH